MEGINIRHQSSHALRADTALKMMEPCLPMDTPKRRFSWREIFGFFLESEIFLATCQNLGVLKKNPFQFGFFLLPGYFFGLVFLDTLSICSAPSPQSPPQNTFGVICTKPQKRDEKNVETNANLNFDLVRISPSKKSRNAGVFFCETVFAFF